MPGAVQLGKQLSVTCLQGRYGTVVELSGVIDESFDSKKLMPTLGKSAIVFDFDHVSRITSYGVREWVHALKDLEADYVCFVNCRPAIVSQFNMVSNFGGTGELLSIYAPYVCQSCGAEMDVPVDLVHEHAKIAALEVPVVKCTACGGSTEFDDVAESYFSYVAAAPAPRPPQSVEKLLHPAPKSTSAPFRVTKEVLDHVTALWMNGALEDRTSLKRLTDGLEGTVVALLGGISKVSPNALARFVRFANMPDVDVHL